MIEFVIVFLVFYHKIINFASGYIFHPMKTTKEYILLISSKAEELKRDFGIKSLRIFGSVSRNEQHEGSDVDVCVDMEPKTYMVVRLKRFLEDLLQCSVDVIRLHKHINPYLLDEIDRGGDLCHQVKDRIRLIIASYQFTCFINIYFALNVLASRSFQVIGSLQTIHGLQSDCSLPKRGFLPLGRLTLTDVFVEVGIMLSLVIHIALLFTIC